MRLRVLSVLASALMLFPVTIGLVSASSTCDDASAALDAELEASGYTITPAVAVALKNAVEACPPTESTSPSTGIPVPGALGPRAPPTEAHVVIEKGLAGSTCGYTSVMTGHHDDAPLTAYRMVVLYTDVVDENGPADVAYDPTTNVASYAVTGPTHGMAATGAAGVNGGATGSVLVYGVSIPALFSTVDTGCGVNNPELCWGYGYAEVVFRNIGIAVISAFNHC